MRALGVLNLNATLWLWKWHYRCRVLWWITVSLVLPKLSMLFEASAACLWIRMCERGKGKGRWKERRRRGGDRGKKVSKLQTVWIRDGCFFSIFSNNLTYCYTAAGRLIHSSAGSQYLNSNYRGNFLLSLAVTHHWIRSPSAIRPAWITERKSITWVLHMPKDLNINNLLVVPWQNKHLTEFFFFSCESHSRGTARCIILLHFCCSPLVVWFVLCSALWCVVKNPLAANATVCHRVVTTQFTAFEIENVFENVHFFCLQLFKVCLF